MKYLLQEGLLDGSCRTVTGRTLAENLNDLPGLKEGQSIVRTVNNPLKPTGHIQILRGNLAPEGAVAKITGKEGLVFSGPARCYDGEEAMLEALQRKEIQKGDVIIIRYEGPKGGPGMPEMLTPTSAIMGAGLGSDVALMTDGPGRGSAGSGAGWRQGDDRCGEQSAFSRCFRPGTPGASPILDRSPTQSDAGYPLQIHPIGPQRLRGMHHRRRPPFLIDSDPAC
jgi:hypothetical protein